MPVADIGEELRYWRRSRGLSQLELSLRAEVSQRHVSFLETGRSRPSPDMVRRLADTLDIAPREQNRLLLLAGYAPAFPERALDDLGGVTDVLDHILAAQHPQVAFILDRAWNVLRANSAAGTFVGLAFPERPAWLGPPLNVARASLHPDGLRRCMPDWEQSAARLLRRLERHTAAHPHEPDLVSLLDEVRSYPGVADLPRTGSSTTPDLLWSTRYHLGGEDIALFTTIMTIGDPIDLTLAELRLETFWPADTHSAAAWQRLAATAPPT